LNILSLLLLDDWALLGLRYDGQRLDDCYRCFVLGSQRDRGYIKRKYVPCSLVSKFAHKVTELLKQGIFKRPIAVTAT
jgi:hypothetical protein